MIIQIKSHGHRCIRHWFTVSDRHLVTGLRLLLLPVLHQQFNPLVHGFQPEPVPSSPFGLRPTLPPLSSFTSRPNKLDRNGGATGIKRYSARFPYPIYIFSLNFRSSTKALCIRFSTAFTLISNKRAISLYFIPSTR